MFDPQTDRALCAAVQSHDLRANVIHVPAVLVPGLRPVSVKGIQAALRAAWTRTGAALHSSSPRCAVGSRGALGEPDRLRMRLQSKD
jgi:hypothetical protein